MVSTDKLIKVGVKYSDSYFETLKNIYNNAYRNNESLEEFLNDTQDYSIGNPLEAGGFKDTLTNLIASSTNDIRFSRPAQKALMNTIIRNTTGELIVDVGNDVKQSVRDIVAKGYNTRTLSRQNVADEISSTLDGINRKRARTIARTEIKRAQTTSNYIVALERGANAYKYKCGAKPCDICKVDCGETFPIDDMEHLPPRHPNCMCGVSFFKDPSLPDVESTSEDENNTPTEPTLKNTAYQLNNRDNSYSNVIIEEKHLKEIIDFQLKRQKNKIEYGNCIFLDDATMYHQTDVKGSNKGVVCRRPNVGRDFAFVHNHPGSSNATFSGADMRNQLEFSGQKFAIATTPEGIWIARDTEYGTHSKNGMGITDDTISHVMYGMNAKVNEFAKPIYEEKYKPLLENATDKKEFNKLKEGYRKEYIAQYNDWVLETYGVGKNKYNYFEIEFISNEELKNVQF